MSVNVPAEDRFAILDVLARYSRAEDMDDAEGYTELFAPDGVCGMRDKVYHGREEILAWMKTLHLKGFRHNTTQTLFEEGDDKRCRVSSYSTIFFSYPDGSSEMRYHAIYRDVFVKLDDGKWYFQERRWEPWDVQHPEKYKPLPR